MHNDPQHWSSAYDYRILDNIVKLRYELKPSAHFAFELVRNVKFIA